MNRKVLLLNVALLALGVTLVWQLRQFWVSSNAHARQVFAQKPSAKPVLAPPAPVAPAPPVPADYAEVAQRTLFSRDRNPNVVIEVAPPPPPPPPKPMPTLPLYYGQMSFGTPVAILSEGSSEQKGYHVGEQIGPFTLIAFDRENITLEWDGQTVERKLLELKPKPAANASAAAPAPSASAPAAGGSSIRSLSGGSTSSNAPSQPSAPALGTDMGNGFRACAGDDTSPAGTMLEGYRKVVARTLMGTSCHWEKTN